MQQLFVTLAMFFFQDEENNVPAGVYSFPVLLLGSGSVQHSLLFSAFHKNRDKYIDVLKKVFLLVMEL